MYIIRTGRRRDDTGERVMSLRLWLNEKIFFDNEINLRVSVFIYVRCGVQGYCRNLSMRQRNAHFSFIISFY